jgi:uncharacterized protein (DUF736 family)
MANIGTFTAQNDSFTGTVRTLTLNVKVKFVPNAKESENAPDYRIVAGNFEIGAAWKKISKAERPYLSATLDDPSFPATIYARLVEGEDGAHNLIWSRSKIRSVAPHSSAAAILKISGSEGMCSPRSILPMCERSMPARCASASWAMPCSERSARTAAPKACASSASKVVAPAGRPAWMGRFCMDRSVLSRDN